MNDDNHQNKNAQDNDPSADVAEARMASVLRALDANAPQPDASFLNTLRGRALAEFGKGEPMNSTVAAQQVVSVPVVRKAVSNNPTSSRAKFVLRGLAALAAAVAILVVGLNLGDHNTVSGAPFSKVLENLRNAKTLQLKVSKAGEPTQVWVQAPGLVRWEDSPTQYRIAAGSRLWKIDETTNTAKASDSELFIDPNHQIDLLGLLEVGVTDAAPLLTAEPAARLEYAGRNCDVYRATLPTKNGRLRIEAFVEAGKKQLVGIIANPAEQTERRGPPLAELQLVAMNPPVDESKFVVGKSLTEDGRIGKIADSQGLVVLRPMLSQRWTPIARETLLKTGDWIRTDVRGANATKIRLTSEVELTLGPGSLIELTTPTQARLHRGEVQVNVPKQERLSFELLAPRDGKQSIAAAKQLWRVDRSEKLVEQTEPPTWLKGFEGTLANESLGSLIVQIDGRNEPLTVGYHKVSVEIRDQIARTTIEESFVNHTNSRLEGIFHFPLPADASISGFGMWIGNDLVEADVVEKQRAREIYETILREKRDPGLLEWTAGNLFKARVFPIEAHSEKRVKIVYTQVLPLQGNKYRYSYGLRSEMLRTKPLRELSLSVLVNSALPLASVASPTHTVRATSTPHSAQLDFAAQEYTPERDFEVVCEVQSRNSDVVVVPHRRGSDGYFLMQLTPPAREGNFQREVLPDGKPLTLVLLCDTSASMDAEKRKQQAEFVGTVLSSLSEKDRFWLAAADVETVWSSPEAQQATPENIAKAREFLDGRTSLGWTNLDKAFATTFEKLAAEKEKATEAQIVYIGDGIVTAGERDPNAFVKKLARLVSAGGNAGPPTNNPTTSTINAPTSTTRANRTFHAITTGNTYDATVLKGIAVLGHGSVRNITGEQTPVIVAKELLNEIAQPGLRDLKVEFRGVKVAAVYPEVLPPVAAGTQQILVGRYLPTGNDQSGEVVVTGTLGGEPVKYVAKINLKDAEAGNSFIPRLWARGHLDHLLQQGAGAMIREEIISLSEEFHIITPYTSLLVLETDADRERFGVKRRFEMRDGERFFADGKKNANYELQQKQMLAASDWRLSLRRQVLQNLAGLGRNSQVFQQQVQVLNNNFRTPQFIAGVTTANEWVQDDGIVNQLWGGVGFNFSNQPLGNSASTRALSNRPAVKLSLLTDGTSKFLIESEGYEFGGPASFGGYINPSELVGLDPTGQLTSAGDIQFRQGGFNAANGPFGGFDGSGSSDFKFNLAGGGGGGGGRGGFGGEFGAKLGSGRLSIDDANGDFTIIAGLARSEGQRQSREISELGDLAWDGFFTNGLSLGVPLQKSLRDREDYAGNFDGDKDDALLLNFEDRRKAEWYGDFASFKPGSGLGSGGRRSNRWSGGQQPYNQPNYTTWLNQLFPALSPPLVRNPRSVAPIAPAGWSADAIALSKSLLRTDSLAKLSGGIELRRTTNSFDPRWNRQTSHQRDLALYSPTAWITRSLNSDAHTLVNYADAKERGVFSLAFLLGRTRAIVDRDLDPAILSLNDFSLAPLHEGYRNQQAKVEPAGENQVRLILTVKDSPGEQRITIDTARHVILKYESLNDGKLLFTNMFSDFVELGGSWWAKSIVTTNAKGQKTAETTFEINALDAPKFASRLSVELSAKPQAVMLQLPGPSLKTARERVADGSANFEDRLVMILLNCNLQQWDELFKHLDAAEKLAVDKPGMRWVRTLILATIRRNEEARQRLLEDARKLVAAKQQDEAFLAEFILGQAGNVASPAERLELVNLLQPVYDRQPEASHSKQRWQEQLLGCYESLNRPEDAQKLRRTLAEQMPWEIHRQTDYARRLLQAGETDAAYAWLQKEFDRNIERDNSEDESLRTAYAQMLRTQGRWEDLLKFTTAWVARNPEYTSAYLQHISALVYNDKLDEARTLAQQWLKAAQIVDKLQPDQRVRLDAAISFAQGNAHELQIQQFDTRWLAPLDEAARYFIQQKDKFDLGQRIANDHRFSQTAFGDRFRGFALATLQADADKLPLNQLDSYIGWALSGRLELAEPIDGRKQLEAHEVPERIWKQIAATVLARWQKLEYSTEKTSEAARNNAEKNQLSETVRNIYASRFSATELLPFLRERIRTAPAEFKQGFTVALFDALVGRAWTEANEQESFKLLGELTAAEYAGDRLVVQVPALYRLVDALLAARIGALETELRDGGKVNELTRTELMEKRAGFTKTARTGLAARLAQEVAKQPGPLAPWLRMEKAWLDVQLGENLADVQTLCWEILGELPPKPNTPAPNTAEPNAENDNQPIEVLLAKIREEFFKSMLYDRAFATVSNLTARRNAEPQAVERLLKYIDAGIAQGTDLAALWRVKKFQMLVTLDKPDDLERNLRDWVRTEPITAPWRKSLAILLAERGKLPEAIQLFEAAEKDQLLTAADYRMLADWYFADDRRTAYERARFETFKLLPEQNVNQMLWNLRNRWNQTPLPSELDENTLLALKALFEKSANPENYFGPLRELYGACRDFRLLQMLPDALLGRSPQQIYPFLQNVRSQVLQEVRNEATADEIIARIKKLREGKLTPTDQRALDLFEAIVERRSSEVLNQPGPHIDKFLAAMKRAFDRPWSDGEPILMANFLRDLGTLPRQDMIDEQLRELRALQEQAKAASREHLTITNHLCSLLFWSYGKHDEAIQSLQAEIQSYQQARDGVWPHEDNQVLSEFVRMHEDLRRFAAGEQILQTYSNKSANSEQRKWFEDRLLVLYNNALSGDGEVSLGKGDALFTNILNQELKRLDNSPDENVRQNVVSRLCNTFEIARQKKLRSTNEALNKFAFETMPAVLKRQQGQYRSTATAPIHVISEALGPRVALQYIVERMEQWPQRLEISWDTRWNTLGHELARRRHEAAGKSDLAALEPRVLKLAVEELKREIRTGQSGNRHIYYIHHQYYWAEKADDFARAAEEVYAESKNSGRQIMAVANYLWNGLHRFPRAIEVLLVAHRDGLLDENAQNHLVQWLHEQKRFAESIAILEPLVELHQDNMHYRTLLMVAYHKSQRPDQLASLVKGVDEYFHKEGRWNEGNVSAFGIACADCSLNQQAVGYLSEAISLHRRDHGERVLNDSTLSYWYQRLADAHIAQGHTKEAVDAASSAIICWGPQQSQRTDALNKLKQVLQLAKDLPEYVKHLDAQLAKTGEDSPILRKALGQVFESRNLLKEAIVQLQLAAELQPNDKETHQSLINCYDRSEDRPAGTRQLLKLIDLDRHNLALYQQLADRLQNQPAEAERAVTSLIESGPQESESHSALAEIRQKQNRWTEAIEQWTEVANLRSLEPTGLVKLAEAQIHEKDWDGAHRSIEKLQRTEWPSRFNNVTNETRQLQARLPK